LLDYEYFVVELPISAPLCIYLRRPTQKGALPSVVAQQKTKNHHCNDPITPMRSFADDRKVSNACAPKWTG
jgi:hypothetical protein